MFYSTLFIAATALTGLVSAQNYSTSGPLYVVPSSVSPDLRAAWCKGQTNTCPLLCGGQAFPNNCSADTLTYDCKCTNGPTPNISAYDQTLPSFICNQWVGDCTKAHPNDLPGQTACQSVVCGTKNASDLSSTGSSGSSSSASSAAPSGSATASSTSGGSSGSASASSAAAAASSSGAAVANIAINYGTGIFATIMIGMFGIAL